MLKSSKRSECVIKAIWRWLFNISVCAIDSSNRVLYRWGGEKKKTYLTGISEWRWVNASYLWKIPTWQISICERCHQRRKRSINIALKSADRNVEVIERFFFVIFSQLSDGPEKNTHWKMFGWKRRRIHLHCDSCALILCAHFKISGNHHKWQCVLARPWS